MTMADGRRALIIFNPTAGRGRASKSWPQIEEALEASLGGSMEVATTEGPGHATELAAKASGNGFNMVLACGGDGTIHEVINGLGGQNGSPPLAIVPAGTGNDFARTLGIPLDSVKAASGLARPRLTHIDLGKVGDRYFANVGGVGFDAEVAAEVNKAGRLLRGAVPYVWAVLKKLFTYSATDLTVYLDDERLDRRALLVAVGVASYYGGGMKILPGADVQDGLLDVCIAGDVSKLATVVLLPKLFSGSHIHHPKIEMRRARTVRVEGPEHLHVHTDGEVIGHLPITFSSVHRGLALALPDTAEADFLAG